MPSWNSQSISSVTGGARTNSDQPEGPGYAAIRDGINQAWDFGAGTSVNRNGLSANNGSWPNIIKFDILGNHNVAMGGSVSNKYYFQFGQSAADNSTVQVYLDTDANPYNGDSGQVIQRAETGTGTNVMRSRIVSFSPTNKPPGQYYVYAKVTGGTHTRYLYAPEKLTILDVTPPFVSITNPASSKTYTNAQTVTISANATDNVAVASVAFYDSATPKATNTTAPYTYDWSFTGTDNATHAWTARAYDAAGNVSTSSAVTLTVSIDITPPTVVISSPTNGHTSTTSPFTVRGTATDPGSPTSGVSVVQVRLNGGSWSNATGTTSWTNTVTLSPCATNTIEARSLDKAGNYSDSASNFVTYMPPNTVPNTPSNVSPANGATNVSLTVTLQAGPFIDADCIGDTHAASQWQVLNSAGAVVVADSGTDTVNKVSWVVPTNKLYYGSNYQWQVRYRDSRNGWSSNSVKTAFTTFGPLLSGSKQGTNIVFQWPTNTLGFRLQWSTNLGTKIWSNATPAPVVVSGQYTVTNSMTNSASFYRLKK